MENENLVIVQQAEALEALNRSEVDMQIATAKRYPRDVDKFLREVEKLASMDKEVAADCFYVLRRDSGGGDKSIIEGLSVRMAEIIAGAWGNLRCASRIIGNDGKTITAQAVCIDLERNIAISKEVKRRITNKYGKTFSEDMQIVTGNAAAAIAFRNAVLAVVPKAITKKVIDNVKKVALGSALDLETSRKNIVDYFAKLGVTKEQIAFYLGIDNIKDLTQELILELRATANAINEGTTSVDEAFIKPYAEHLKAEVAKKEQNAAAKKVADAMAQAAGDNAGEAK